MIKQTLFLLLVAFALVFAQDQCGANVSGPNVASAARSFKRQAATSASCLPADVSGPNVASAARRWKRQNAQICSGNGFCTGTSCSCISGWEGAECQTRSQSPSCQTADVSGPNVASPAKRQSAACNGNGSCNGNVCSCSNGWYGASCEIPVSSSCGTADVSGPNVASPAKRQNAVCSGNGYCFGDKVCVCNAGFSGSNCESQATTCIPASSTASQTTVAPSQDTTVAPVQTTTIAPSQESTIAPTTEASTTIAPSQDTTVAPVQITTTVAPSQESTIAPTMEASTTIAPSQETTTVAPTENTSGDNNARATNNAGKLVSIGGVISAAIVVALL